MCLKQYEWADFRETKSGIKLHISVVFVGEESYPNAVIPTPARPADETQLDALMTPDKKALHIFDRGYFNFEKFDLYSLNGVRFVTRVKSNTVVHVIEELPVDPSSSITRHAIVKIGTMKTPLQLVETVDRRFPLSAMMQKSRRKKSVISIGIGGRLSYSSNGSNNILF